MLIRFIRCAAAGGALLLCASVSVAQGQDVSLPPELQEVRAGLEKYQDVIVAVHDGYLSTVGCIEYPKGMVEGSMAYPAGGMGVHLINLNFISPELDPTKPQVLIYEPHGDELRLVAAEWFMPVPVAGEIRSFIAIEPPVVTRPVTSQISFRANGMPWNGPIL